MSGQGRAVFGLFLLSSVLFFCLGVIFRDWLSINEVKPEPVRMLEAPDPLPYSLPPMEYIRDVLWWTEKTGVPFSVVVRLFSHESSLSGFPTDPSWQEDAVSYVGAIGIPQIMPENLTDPLFIAFNDGLAIDPTNQHVLIKVGIRYLRYLYNLKGSWKLAVGAYNGGPNRPVHLWKPQTVRYVKIIMGSKE